MARYLEVSRSNFYNYLNRLKRPFGNVDESLLSFVFLTWSNSRKSYGLPRILDQVNTTDSRHADRTAPDLVKRDFETKKKNEVWVSDVTYIKASTGWLYLCVILDLYSRKVVGWALSNNNDSDLVSKALHKAITLRNPGKGLIFHSDRGSNYCSDSVRRELILNRIRRSNSRKGNCWDNAVNVFLNLKDAYDHLFDYIEIFYNRQRSHSFLSYVSSDQFELKEA